MNKYLFLLPAAAMFMAGCSSDNDETPKSDELTPVKIYAETGMADNTTRAVWALPQEDKDGNTTISVKFEPGEGLDVYEYGYEGKQVFNDADQTEYQSANFAGSWHANGTRWAAVLPAGAANSVTCGATGNTYNITMPSEQWTVDNKYMTGTGTSKTEVHAMSPDRNANIMVGSKDTHTTATCFLSPICAYLYFATDPNVTTVKIKTTGEKPLAGNLVVGTGANKEKASSYEWDGWENFVKCINTITPTTYVKEITVHGQKVTRNNVQYCEYIACVFPTTYSDLQITKEDGTVIKSSTKSNTFDIVNLYYLGYFKTATATE